MCRGQNGRMSSQRGTEGTCITIELFAALHRGYLLLDVYEVWHFEEVSCYSKETGGMTLFGGGGGYVDAFIKLKTESSGLHDDCTNPD